MNEVCDESRFSKIVALALEQVRNGVHDGLFTAYPGEHNWEIAHRVLVPAFGPLSIRGMFDEMHDIASQLVMKWARHGRSYVIPVTDDFTRLTLDTLALCAMDYRFNSYYQNEMHPFVDAMGEFLTESGNRTRRPAMMAPFYRQQQLDYDANIELMRKTSDEVVRYRKEHPNDRKDLLNAMIKGKDPKTGESLSDRSITDNMITFLIAGHETTSGLLSFVFYYLLKSPEAYQKAQQEVDGVIGKGPIKVEHMSRLPYITAILRETLRLMPTAPAISLQALEDEVIGGKYRIPKGEPVVALLPKIHQDPAVYGDDAGEWKPERMLDENFSKLPPNAWKPFGNGMRACIGRPFAWQEALLVVAILLQNFNFAAEDSSYKLKFKQTLTIKPKEFYMRAVLRDGMTPTQLEQSLLSSAGRPSSETKPASTGKVVTASKESDRGQPLSIFYGSNTGTCEAFAQRLASDAPMHGFRAKVVDSLDSVNQNLPTDVPVVIITASYEGQPPDNAVHFYRSLESLKGDEMSKVAYSVFGCGHSDWKTTFHRIPNAIDRMLEERGGERIAARGGADASHGDMFTEFETWEDQVFWPAMRPKYGGSGTEPGPSLDSSFDVTVSSTRSHTLRQDVEPAKVLVAKALTAPGAPLKKHIEIQLPSEMTYSAGDYLAILPVNPQESVQRVMRRFGLPWDAVLVIGARSGTTLPTDTPIPAVDLFGAYVELAQPATKRNVAALLEATKDSNAKEELKRLSGPAFTDEISARRVSVLDLLDRFPSISLPLGSFIAALPPMRVRQYSISSSPLWNPHHVILTYSVLDQPSLSGHGRYVGVASNYLAHLDTADTLHVAVRSSNQAFHLPADAEHTPVIMIAAGTGLAPFRGFVQERAAQIGAGRSLAPALLFFGCRAPDTDDLYADEFARWAQMGAVDVRRAYSRASTGPASHGCKYVQDRVWADRADVVELWDRGARVFVCGSRDVGEAVRSTCLRIYEDRARELGKVVDEEKAEAWFDGIRNDRYATDVFA
ncbi:bifunctional P-450/NADPH-P450 reductase [Cryomyces antarcticus]